MTVQMFSWSLNIELNFLNCVLGNCTNPPSSLVVVKPFTKQDLVMLDYIFLPAKFPAGYKLGLALGINYPIWKV